MRRPTRRRMGARWSISPPRAPASPGSAPDDRLRHRSQPAPAGRSRPHAATPPARTALPGSLALRGLALVATLAAWHLAASTKLDLGILSFRNVPAPAEAARAAWALLHSPVLASHLAASLARVLSGFLTALVLASASASPSVAPPLPGIFSCRPWRCCARFPRSPGSRWRS